MQVLLPVHVQPGFGLANSMSPGRGSRPELASSHCCFVPFQGLVCGTTALDRWENPSQVAWLER